MQKKKVPGASGPRRANSRCSPVFISFSSHNYQTGRLGAKCKLLVTASSRLLSHPCFLSERLSLATPGIERAIIMGTVWLAHLLAHLGFYEERSILSDLEFPLTCYPTFPDRQISLMKVFSHRKACMASDHRCWCIFHHSIYSSVLRVSSGHR